MIYSIEEHMSACQKEAVFTPAKAYWSQRFVLQSARERILALSDAVNNKTDLWPYQLAQLMAAALEFKPDLILELGRGKGNSTCGFTEVANQLNKNGGNCRVVSLCISEDWEKVTQWQVLKFVDDKWFNPLTALRGNILTFNYDSIFKGVSRCLLFWDAHGFDVAECVLGRILPGIAGMSNLVIMHDLSDTRYIPPDTALYKDNRIWRGNDWSGPRLRLGYIDSSVEQAVAIVDFTSRNNIPFDSADHSFDMGIKSDTMKYKEMQEVLGSDLFNLGAHWFWFTLNGAEAPLTFPSFQAPVMKDHVEINMYEHVRIMDVSLRDTVLNRPDRVNVIKRINNYLGTGKAGLASRIIEKEFGHLKEASEILSRINKYDNEKKVIISGQYKGEGY